MDNKNILEKKNELMKRWRKITDLLDKAEELIKSEEKEDTLYCDLYYDKESESCDECPLYEAGICAREKTLRGISWVAVDPIIARVKTSVCEARQNAGQIFSTIYGDVWGENE